MFVFYFSLVDDTFNLQSGPLKPSAVGRIKRACHVIFCKQIMSYIKIRSKRDGKRIKRCFVILGGRLYFLDHSVNYVHITEISEESVENIEKQVFSCLT